MERAKGGAGGWFAGEWRALGRGSETDAWREGAAWEAMSNGQPAGFPRFARGGESGTTYREWTRDEGGVVVTRALLRSEEARLAIAFTEWSDPETPGGAAEARWPLAPEVAAEALEPGAPNSRWSLTRGAGAASLHLVPLADPNAGESFEIRAGAARARGSAGRTPPLLLSWDGRRHRRNWSWRRLTVTERGREMGPAEVFAARLTWGLETYLVCRFAERRPGRGPGARGFAAPRAVLGHQTWARVLLGVFNADGAVEPLLSLED